MVPKRRMIASTAAPHAIASRTSKVIARASPPARAISPSVSPAGGDVEHRDLGAGPRETECRRLADTASGAGDHRHLIPEIEMHEP
jgi:hypothetical protein